MIIRIMILAIVVKLGIAMCSSDVSSFSTSPKKSLEATLSGDEENPVLTIQLRNTGDETLEVDKELVFLPNIVLVDDKRQVIAFHEISTIKKPSDSVLKSRLISLKPGEEIKRVVHLRKGFKQFVTGISIPAGGESESPRVTAYEAISQMPANIRPFQIEVSYKPLYSFEEGLAAYMQGIKLDQFFRGPLRVSLPYKFSNSTIRNQNEYQGKEDAAK